MSKFTASLKKLIMELYEDHLFLLQENARVSAEALARFQLYRSGSAGPASDSAFSFLAELLLAFYGRKCIVLVDDFDVPFIAGHAYSYLYTVESVMSRMCRTLIKVGSVRQLNQFLF